MITWSPGVTLDDIEKQVILKAYRFFGNNKTITAKALGIAVRTLDYKLDRYNGVEHERQEPETQNDHGTSTGLRVEPIDDPTPQHGVPVRKRKKV